MAKIDDSNAPTLANPAISIIIPLYNAEKYISEALESILVQTFQNFEVIVVDDCSTDSSSEVVESYIPKFNGRLSLFHMIKNSGCAPAPRNNGFLISRGEYIFFMDSDDTFTKTALEEMYGLAKEYDADVVYCEKYFMSTGVGEEFIKNIHPADSSIQQPPFVDKPTLISDNLGDRLEELFQRKFWVTPWQRLVSRKLLVENDINFPIIIGSDDVVWCLAVLCFAKKFLRVPNSCYVRRMYDESFTKSSKKSPNRHIHQWMDITIRGLQFVDNFMDKLDFFRDNPEYRYKLFQHLSTRHSFNVVYPVCKELPINQVYEIFLKEFANDNGEHNTLISYLCTRIYSYDDEMRENRRKIKSLNDAAQKDNKRIVELESKVKYLIDEISRLKREQTKLTEIPSLLQLTSENLALPAPIPPAKEVKPSSCAISVVVPMFNAEEFIGECLDSLLIQTFQDFEVIVADDCSTDNSIKIVEYYAPKFNGRLQLTRTKTNSGGGGYIPRNLGLSLAGGEYVIFLDADDFLLGSALETLYNAAQKYDAEVVYSSCYYNVKEFNDVYFQRDGLGRKWAKEGIEDKLALTINDRHKILQEFVTPGSGEGNFRHPWSKFVRRDYLLKNNISFPDIITGGDCVWCINVYAHANRFLRLPTPLYFYRRYNTSLTRALRAPSEQISYWVEAFVAFLNALNELQNRTEFLKKNPYYCYEAVRGGHFEWCLNRTNEARMSMSNPEVYEVLYREFNKATYMPDALVPFFFSVIDNDRKLSSDNIKLINSLKSYITARIDIEFLPELAEGDFQILSISDDRADVAKPEWLQKDIIGYVIQSYAGKIEIFAKATVNGQLTLKLKGIDIRDRKDKSKRIPYWIDYTRLTLNEEKIFGKSKSVWHDKPYRYTVNVKAFQEIIVKLEWLPHRSYV